MTQAFLDANIVVYASGGPHPLRAPCQRVIDLVSVHVEAFTTNAEAFQELLHLYVRRGLWPESGRGVYERFARIMHGRVEAVLASDVDHAAALADEYRNVDARDLVHAAVMKRLGIEHIVSADTDFDYLPNITRLDPANVAVWREELFANGA